MFRSLTASRAALACAASLAAATTLASGCRAPGAAHPAGPAGAAAPSAERFLADVSVLAADSLEGRMTGTRGNDLAATYIADRLRALGLRPVVADSTGRPGYFQRFVARSAMLAHQGGPAEMPTQNVVALIPGTDPALRGQVVVLGAHFDHLGRDRTFARDPGAGDAIRNGADDNASGTAAVLELARLLAAQPPRRSVLVALFTGEELGLLGSQHLVDHLPMPVDSVVAMLNFDMVGRLTNDRVLVYGTGTATGFPALVDSANAAGPRLDVRRIADGMGPSDHAAFYPKGIPVLHFFTDVHADYHSATDDVALVNAPGAARVMTLALGVARSVADAPTRPALVRMTTPPRTASGASSGGPRPYLGSVPDMAGDGGTGLRLSAVTPGSPADQGGLRGGDVVVEFDGVRVTDLQTYSDALNARKPGDTVSVVVLRTPPGGGAPQRVAATVTLGRRGG